MNCERKAAGLTSPVELHDMCVQKATWCEMNEKKKRPELKGRGSQIHPPNRFLQIHTEDDFEHLEYDDEYFESLGNVKTEYFSDVSKSIVSENKSPDISFRYSLNPYRGCAHGCSYCYARPYHEYLGLNAGLDFESKIFVKESAPLLFKEFLAKPKWVPQTVVLSGVTDCYQPIERKLKLTRQCLEIASEANQPIGLITKNAMVTRDIDILESMAQQEKIRVNISLTTLDAELARKMEPRTSVPAARLRAIKELSEVGVPVNVMIAPVIPGMNDSEIPKILEAIADVGAHSANYTILRLPLTVHPVFMDWLERTYPEHKERVLTRLRACRDGNDSNSEFGSRMRGTGIIAEQIRKTFDVFSKKFRLNAPLPPLSTRDFIAPVMPGGQRKLF